MIGSGWILIGAGILYAGLHSFLAAEGVKQWVRERLPGSERWYRLAYNGIALLTLLPIVWLLDRLPDRTLYVMPTPWRWLARGGQLVALVGLTVSVLQTNPLYFGGLSQLAGERAAEDRLVTGGLYRYVRHPLYSTSALFLLLSPTMTVNRFIVVVLAVLYFYLGSIHEERRLEAAFGSAYRVYRRRVPRFVPRLR